MAPTPGSVRSSARASSFGQRAQPLRVEPALDGRLRQAVQPADLLGADPWTSRRPRAAAPAAGRPGRPRRRSRSDRRAARRGGALIARGLAHRDALADDERGGRLVRGVEADRPEAVVVRLERADDRIALPDLGQPLPSWSSDSERAACALGASSLGARDLAVDEPPSASCAARRRRCPASLRPGTTMSSTRAEPPPMPAAKPPAKSWAAARRTVRAARS